MMDAAKAVAFCAVNGGDVNDYISGGKQGTGCLPILEVPTTCGTGSEANPFAVLTNPETKDKKSLWGSLIYPKVSFIDPELMKTMPKEVLASVGFDALSHNMEGYLATRSQPITDQLALHAIRLTAGSLPKVYHGEGTQEDWGTSPWPACWAALSSTPPAWAAATGWSIRSAACITWSMERDWRP